MIKHLVTSGCSFSECRRKDIKSWPMWLQEGLPGNVQGHHLGLTGQGNGLISRKLIYQVSELLKTVPAEELMVGVMWSGTDRHDFYTSNPPIIDKSAGGWKMENPTTVAKNGGTWVIVNQGTKFDCADDYYRVFHDNIGSLVYTLEHILRVQWFLKLHKVPYFMTTYWNNVILHDLNTQPDLEHLYQQVDFDQFLPVNGEYQWCKDYSGQPFKQGDHHPTSIQHELFVNRIVLPFVKEKYYE